MEVILKANVPHLGNMMDVVNVKNGFAMNYLIPNKLAIRATAEAKKKIAENRTAPPAEIRQERYRQRHEPAGRRNDHPAERSNRWTRCRG